MNRLIIIAAISSLLLTGCVKSEVVSPAESESGEEITLSAYLGRQLTKGSTPYMGAMKVCAYMSSNQEKYFLNSDFIYDSSSSKYYSVPAHHWPLSLESPYDPLNLDFYAVSSTSGSYLITTSTVSSANDTKQIVVGSTVPVSGSDDLVAATVTGKKKGDAVSFGLGHKLTKVSFKVIGADAGLKYVVSDITVKAMSTATYTFGSSETWTGHSNSKSDYSFTITDGTLDYGTLTHQMLGASGYGLMLIPRQPSNVGTVTASVTYSVYQRNTGGNDVRIYNGTKVVDLSESAYADWRINKSVVYVMTLPEGTPGSSIEFKGEVSEWGEDTEIDRILINWTEPAGMYFRFYNDTTRRNLQGIFNSCPAGYSRQVMSCADYDIVTRNDGPIHGVFYYLKDKNINFGDNVTQIGVSYEHTATNTSSLDDYFILLDGTRFNFTTYVTTQGVVVYHGVSLLSSGYKYLFALTGGAQFEFTYGTIEGNIGQLDASSSISITGGTLIGNIDAVNPANVSITGGTFSFDPSPYVPAHYTISQTSVSPARWTVIPPDSFQFIRELLAGPETVVSVVDTTVTGECNRPIVIPAGKTLELKGCTFTATGTDDCDAFFKLENGPDNNHQTKLTITTDASSVPCNIYFHGSYYSTVFEINGSNEQVYFTGNNTSTVSSGSESHNLMRFASGVSYADKTGTDSYFYFDKCQYIIGRINVGSLTSSQQAAYIFGKSGGTYTTLTTYLRVTMKNSYYPAVDSGPTVDGVTFTAGMYIVYSAPF